MKRLNKKPKTFTIRGFYLKEDAADNYEIWLAPECPYACKNCMKRDVLKARRFGKEDKFKIEKIIFKKEI